MKGCFFLQRNFAPVGHAMALVFKKKYAIHEHCAFTSLKKNYEFLNEQKDVSYTNILLEEHIHASYKNEQLDYIYLQWLESEYGRPNLWPYLVADRILMHGQFLRLYPYDKPLYCHKDLLRVLQTTAKKVINFLDTEKPNFLFIPIIGSMLPLLIFDIATKKGIRVFSGEFSRLENKYSITENPFGFPSLIERFKKIRNNELSTTPQSRRVAEQIIQSFTKAPVPYDPKATPSKQPINRRRQMKFLLPKNMWQQIHWFARMCTQLYKTHKEENFMRISPWHYIIDRVRKKIRVMIGYSDLYDSMVQNENFAYFSLSFEPELNLLVYSPFAADQIYVIRMLAQSLPVGYKVYVKEHPHMVGFRTRKFYKELKKIPNVKLINPSIKSFDLIASAKLVTAITGTVGFEAVLLRKPVITFGEAFYNELSAVSYCTSMHDLAKLVNKQLCTYMYNHEELIDFLIALDTDTASVDMLGMWTYRETEPDIEKLAHGVEPLVDLLAKKLNIAPS